MQFNEQPRTNAKKKCRKPISLDHGYDWKIILIIRVCAEEQLCSILVLNSSIALVHHLVKSNIDYYFDKIIFSFRLINFSERELYCITRL